MDDPKRRSHPPPGVDRPVAEQSPFPPGKSPWCQKGSVYRTLMANLETYVDGGAAAAVARVADPYVRAFLSQPFAASGWYDLFPMHAMMVQVARLRGVPYFTAVSELSRMMALADLNGVYRAMLRVVSPGLLAPRLPRIQAQYLNFGGVEIVSTESKGCVIQRHDHPRLLVHWYVAVVHGFLPALIEQAGAKGVRLRWDPPEPEGVDDGGFERVGLRFAVSWG